MKQINSWTPTSGDRAQDAAGQKLFFRTKGERKTGWPSGILNGILNGMLIDDFWIFLLDDFFGDILAVIHCMGIPFFSIKRCDRGFWTLLTWKNPGRRAYCICLVPIMAIVILTGRLVRYFLQSLIESVFLSENIASKFDASSSCSNYIPIFCLLKMTRTWVIHGYSSCRQNNKEIWQSYGNDNRDLIWKQ